MSARIYLAIDGKKTGPSGEQEVRWMLAEGTVTPTTLAWKKGLTKWVPLSQLLDSLTVTPTPAATVAAGAEPAPLTVTQHKGINRPVFGIIYAALLMVWFIRVNAALPQEVWLATLPVLVIITIFRLINIGYTDHKLKFGVLLTFLMCVPLLNLCPLAICFCCQPGYAKTKELDKTGQILFTIFIIFVALAVICVIGAFSFFGQYHGK